MDEKYSHSFPLPNGKRVYVQTPEMVELGREFTKEINAVWSKPSHFYHLKEGGHVHALRKHGGNKYFAAVDLSNFFGHVTKSKINRALKSLKFEYDRADYISTASTIRSMDNGKLILPFGFTQSPILSSIVFDHSRLWAAIRTIKKAGVVVSVYVDDIVLSANDADQLAEYWEFLIDEVQESGFSVNKDKSQPVSTEIKVFNIKLSADEMAIDKDRLEAFLTDLFQTDHEPIIKGIFGYVGTVNKDQADYLADKKRNGVF